MYVLRCQVQNPSVTKVFVTPFKIKICLLKVTSFIPLWFLRALEKAPWAAACLLQSLTFLFVPLVSRVSCFATANK